MGLQVNCCDGPFLVESGWTGLPPAVLDPNILSKGVKTGQTTTQFGPACVQTMPRLSGACLRQTKLFQMSCGRQI